MSQKTIVEVSVQNNIVNIIIQSPMVREIDDKQTDAFNKLNRRSMAIYRAIEALQHKLNEADAETSKHWIDYDEIGKAKVSFSRKENQLLTA